MKAVRTVELTGPSGLRFEDVPTPGMGPDDIAVTVCATALNRADLLQTFGKYPAPPGAVQDIPGLEYSGLVAAVGARVTRWKVGDRVMGLCAAGAWAETVVTHERQAMPVPSTVTLEHAAAIPEAFSTAFDALVLQGGMTVNSRVLVHAVASGVGTAAVQLGALYGAHVIGTARTEAKLARVGLRDSVLTAAGPVFAERVKALTGGQGVDLVLDLVGGDFVPESLRALAHQGTVLLVGLVAGASAELPFGLMLAQRLRLVGTSLRARPLEEKAALAREFEVRLLPAFERKTLSPVVDAVLPMSDISQALQRLASNDTVGKLVLTW